MAAAVRLCYVCSICSGRTCLKMKIPARILVFAVSLLFFLVVVFPSKVTGSNPPTITIHFDQISLEGDVLTLPFSVSSDEALSSVILHYEGNGTNVDTTPFQDGDGTYQGKLIFLSFDPLSLTWYIKTTDAQGNITKTGKQIATNVETDALYGDVVINEFVSDPVSGSEEWVEFYNKSSKSLDLAYWTVTDNTGSAKFVCTTDCQIAPNQFFAIKSPVGLNNDGDQIILRNPIGNDIDQVVYGNFDDGNKEDNLQKPSKGKSLGRYPDGSTEFRVFNSPTRSEKNKDETEEDLGITFTLPPTVTAGEGFDVPVTVRNADPSGVYYAKAVIGESTESASLRKGYTYNSALDKWLAWNGPWEDMPTFETGTDGAALFTLKSKVAESAAAGNYYYLVRIRKVGTKDNLDSEAQTFSVNAASVTSDTSNSSDDPEVTFSVEDDDLKVNQSFDVKVNIKNAKPLRDYYVKIRLGLEEGKLSDGRTYNSFGDAWLADNASWTKFPVVYTASDGTESITVSAKVASGNPADTYYMGVRIRDKETEDNYDSGTQTISVGAEEEVSNEEDNSDEEGTVLGTLTELPATGGGLFDFGVTSLLVKFWLPVLGWLAIKRLKGCSKLTTVVDKIKHSSKIIFCLFVLLSLLYFTSTLVLSASYPSLAVPDGYELKEGEVDHLGGTLEIFDTRSAAISFKPDFDFDLAGFATFVYSYEKYYGKLDPSVFELSIYEGLMEHANLDIPLQTNTKCLLATVVEGSAGGAPTYQLFFAFDPIEVKAGQDYTAILTTTETTIGRYRFWIRSDYYDGFFLTFNPLTQKFKNPTSGNIGAPFGLYVLEGWQGTPPRFHPVVLIHGMGGRPSDWSLPEQDYVSLIREMYATDEDFSYPPTWIHTYYYGNVGWEYNYQGDIREIALGLEAVVDDLATRYAESFGETLESLESRDEDRVVDIVGYSMGGLVARQYLIKHQDNHHIRKLVTVAAPHQGSFWMGLDDSLSTLPKIGESLESAVNDLVYKAFDRFDKNGQPLSPNSTAAQQLIPDSEFLDYLNMVEWAPLDVDYSVIYGDIKVNLRERLFFLEFHKELSIGDFAVLVDSARTIPAVVPKEFSFEEEADIPLVLYKKTELVKLVLEIPSIDVLRFSHFSLLRQTEIKDTIIDILST